MRTITLPLPQFGFVVATRALLGAGVGLLLASRLAPQHRRTLGLGLVALGAVTTVPAALWLAHGVRPIARRSAVERDQRPTATTPLSREGDDLL